MMLSRKPCVVCHRHVLVDAAEARDARCIRHGGTAYMRPVLDEMVAEMQPTGLIRVAWRQKVVGLFLPSEALELAKLLVDVVEKSKQENQMPEEKPAEETLADVTEAPSEASDVDEEDDDEIDDEEEDDEVAASEESA